jgi:Fe-S cluster biogenesis protein NfuA
MAEPSVLGPPDEDVRELIERLDSLLEQLERSAGPVAEVATRAVRALATVYGAALGRVVALSDEKAPQLTSALAEDELLHHLLALHGIHPWPPEQRIRRALAGMRHHLDPRGQEVELAGIEDGVALLRLSRGERGCGSSAAAIEQAITDGVLAAAPELRDARIQPEPGRRSPVTVIPVESLLRKPARPLGPPGGTP